MYKINIFIYSQNIRTIYIFYKYNNNFIFYYYRKIDTYFH